MPLPCIISLNLSALPRLNCVDRFASNTLRVLSIVLTAGLMFVGSVVFLFLAKLAFQVDFGGNRHPDTGHGFIFATVVLDVVGIAIIVFLARGLQRVQSTVAVDSFPTQPVPARTTPPLTAPARTSSTDLHLSPPSRAAIHLLVYALVAKLVIGILNWIRIIFLAQSFTTPRLHRPNSGLFTPIAFSLPYIALIYWLLKRPNRTVFAYSLAVPAISLLQSFLGLGTIILLRSQVNSLPDKFAPVVVFLAFDIVILVLAYRAIQKMGLHPEPASLIVAAVIVFLYFSVTAPLAIFFDRFVHI
jgi:hypothetical protein